MKRMQTSLSTLLVAGIVVTPLAALASSDSPYGLIDYKMGIAPVPAGESYMQTNIVVPDQYGVADAKIGAIPGYEVSDGHANRPVSTLIKDSVGIAENKTEAMAPGAVVTADGGAVGTIERVVPGERVDTVYVRASNDIEHRTFSTFKINVPKGALKGDQLHLKMTMGELLAELNGQS